MLCILRTLLDDRVIGQVGEEIRWLPRVVIEAAKAKVALLEDIDAKWVPRGDHDPYADVKLAIHDQHWVLNVLLDHPDFLRVNVHFFCRLVCIAHVELCVCT